MRVNDSKNIFQINQDRGVFPIIFPNPGTLRSTGYSGTNYSSINNTQIPVQPMNNYNNYISSSSMNVKYPMMSDYQTPQQNKRRNYFDELSSSSSSSSQMDFFSTQSSQSLSQEKQQQQQQQQYCSEFFSRKPSSPAQIEEQFYQEDNGQEEEEEYHYTKIGSSAKRELSPEIFNEGLNYDDMHYYIDQRFESAPSGGSSITCGKKRNHQGDNKQNKMFAEENEDFDEGENLLDIPIVIEKQIKYMF